MCSVVRRGGDQCPSHHLNLSGGVLAVAPTGCFHARIWMAPVEGTTEDSEVFIRLEAEKDRLGTADLAGALTQRVVQPAAPWTAGGCIEHPLRSSVGFSCQRKRRSTAMGEP